MDRLETFALAPDVEIIQKTMKAHTVQIKLIHSMMPTTDKETQYMDKIKNGNKMKNMILNAVNNKLFKSQAPQPSNKNSDQNSVSPLAKFMGKKNLNIQEKVTEENQKPNEIIIPDDSSTTAQNLTLTVASN